MLGSARLKLALVATAASLSLTCTRANPDFCATDSECAGGTICDEDGMLGGTKNACVAFTCTPDEVIRCVDDSTEEFCSADGSGTETRGCAGFGCNLELDSCNECTANTRACGVNSDSIEEFVDCDGNGQIADSRECLLGCSEVRVGCVDIDPSNGLSIDLDFIDMNPTDVRDVVLGEGFVIDSDNGEIRDADGNAIESVSTRDVNQQGPDILVFRFRSLVIDGAIEILGDDTVALVSDRDITINGLVDVTAGDRTGGDNCVGDAPNEGNGDASGGGGGGFGENGNNGGNADGEAGGGGGSQTGDEDLDPLEGGCRGGIGTPGPFSGGLGGGALQVVARQRIILGPSGQITAAGKGGGFEGMMVPFGAASGGGSGGGILLEAPEVQFAGGSFVSANGGGGGCQGEVGERGPLSRQPAAGGVCVSATAGNGGNGGSATQFATAGVSASGTDAHGGGGGGGVGRLRINVGPDATPPQSDLFFSPDPTGATIGLRP